MATRSITATLIRYRSGPAGNQFGPVSQLPDKDMTDLLALLAAVLDSFAADPRDDEQRETLTSKVVGNTPGHRTVLGELLHGGYGEDGVVVNKDTGAQEFRYGPGQAPTLTHRLLITVPPSGDAAIVFIEHAARRNPGRPFLDRLVDEWNERFPNYELVTETMQESAAWLQQASLVSATALYSAHFDAADVIGGIPADVSKVIKPQRGYAARMWEQLLHGDPVERAEFFGVDPAELDEIKVVLEVDGREKVMLLDNPRTPSVRLSLCGPKDPFPQNADFLHVCFEEAHRLYDVVGIEWQDGWR